MCLISVSLVLQVADMLLELCVTELEDVATDSQSGRLSSQPIVVESIHPYTDDTSTSGTVKIPGTNREDTETEGIMGCCNYLEPNTSETCFVYILNL